MNNKVLDLNHQKFVENVNSLIKYCVDIITSDKTHKNILINKQDKSILLESLLLRTCANWESFLEKEIVYLVSLDSSKFKQVMGLPENTKLNHKIIKAIIYSDRYKDFHDIGANKSYFSKILDTKNNPFKSLTSERINMIEFIYKIRNYLSHYSDYAKNKLQSAYEDLYNYKKFQEPGVFLIKHKGEHFKKLLHNFVLVSITMKTNIGV